MQAPGSEASAGASEHRHFRVGGGVPGVVAVVVGCGDLVVIGVVEHCGNGRVTGVGVVSLVGDAECSFHPGFVLGGSHGDHLPLPAGSRAGWVAGWTASSCGERIGHTEVVWIDGPGRWAWGAEDDATWWIRFGRWPMMWARRFRRR